jgi:uncharacterized damage-inducible protein DinB
MNQVEIFRIDFEEEMLPTRAVIERMPNDRAEWKPHPKSFSAGHLAQLVSWIPGWVTNIATDSKLDLMRAPKYSIETTETLLEGFDENVRAARAALLALEESRLDEDWSLMAGDKVLFSNQRGPALRQTLRHLVHHRAQLTVYLRLLDVPVPSTYGPTADDRGNFGT